MAGPPEGNLNAYTGRKAKQALEIAVRRVSNGVDGECIEDMECLVQIWVKAIEKAKEEGDLPALNAIMDRLDGKPSQVVNIGGQEGNPVGLQQITFTPVNKDD